MTLGIREARRDLSELVKRAAYGGEEIRIGSRGREEATLVGTAELQRLRREVGELRARLARQQREVVAEAAGAAPRPFAGLQRALDAGVLAVSGGPRQRRRIRGLRTEGGLSREEQARLGSRGAEAPRYRRTAPRA
jgi:prevent-host-death family protein